MKTMKKLISTLLAIALMATLFAGLIPAANAADVRDTSL